MPKINIDSAIPGGPRVEVGWAKHGRDVQVTIGSSCSRLDAPGVDRLIRALSEARGQALGTPVPPRPLPPDVIGRNHDLARALA